LRNDSVEIFQIIFHHKLFVNLQELCLKNICSEPEIIFSSNKFTQLSAHLLEIILKRDDLNLKEIEIWENIIKWGLAQDQIVSQDASKWNKYNINILKKILCKLIPLIRFYEISSEDYFDKVMPYEEILSKELSEDMLKFYMIPEYKPAYIPRIPDSTIINQKHFTFFRNWINRKEKSIKYINNGPYRFILLYRASRDGNTAEVFHAKCDNKGANIVVVKVKDSEQIVGGYNPLFWDSNDGYKSTKDSFIFSFKDKNNFQNAKIVYSNDDQFSIYCHSSNGPTFGFSDLFISYYFDPNIWYSSVSSYPTLNLSGRIKVDDYEVFQVIKN
jgi:hypothetical protein